ncbi:histidinol-phosphate transaminase [Lysobacter sp. A3-1-A15]|uniref:histidinol-phosphate transaminase n=1 Tax=Novilysobacter viscosus TaxID=3098602 RepID=UPI002ED7EFE9
MNDAVMGLVREDLRGFAGYRSARREALQGEVWLNANESPWANPADDGTDAAGGVRRYPDPQPAALRQALAGLYGVAPGQLLAGRGSDEAIDLLVRALCPPGDGAIAITTPTFGMYAVSARLQGARVIDIPLQDGGPDEGYACDFDAVAAQVEAAGARLVFLCSPGNPTGQALALERIEWLAGRLAGRALVVVDEAYGEFARGRSAATLLGSHANIAVLHTLSKAHALAAARIGAVLAAPALIEVLQRCQAPYPLPTPSVELALRALQPGALAVTRARIDSVRTERERLRGALQGTTAVRCVYRSDANFLLCRFVDAQASFQALLGAGLVVRDMRAVPGLDDALRISIGTPEQNARVLQALSARAVAA